MGVDTERLREGTFPLHATTSSFTSGLNRDSETASKLRTISTSCYIITQNLFSLMAKTMNICTQISGKPPKKLGINQGNVCCKKKEPSEYDASHQA